MATALYTTNIVHKELLLGAQDLGLVGGGINRKEGREIYYKHSLEYIDSRSQFDPQYEPGRRRSRRLNF